MALQFEQYLETYDVSEVFNNFSKKLLLENGIRPKVVKMITDHGPDPSSPPLTRAAQTHWYTDSPKNCMDARRSIDIGRRKVNDVFGGMEVSNNIRRCRKQVSLPSRLSSYDSESRHQSTSRRRRNSHNVRFADEVGEMLTSFLIIPSRFDDPTEVVGDCRSESNINPYLSNDENHNLISFSRGESQVDFPFHMCFDQPAARMEELFSKIERQGVSLENVKIDVSLWKQNASKSYCARGRVVCAIKARNDNNCQDPEETRLFARCTNNDWSTYEDFAGIFIDSQQYNTFVVIFEDFVRYVAPCIRSQLLPIMPKHKAAIEFAICCVNQGKELWDNNDGRNYRIIWP